MIIKLVLKLGWILLGSISFVGGIIGMLLPVIPQVPFFLLTIWCITKISPRFHNWLLRNPLYIKYAKPLVNRLENLKHHPKQKTQKINGSTISGVDIEISLSIPISDFCF
ncbi:YbaN family protein [Limosilactobacillus reuteri]|uniref:YbaN family protein n=2 Tax=Limosilactobacillus reuteri TaxID=1598 RepID=UPI00071ED5CD|nr:YbaN family protein [Limosilactobacillus reuteri]MCC4366146.1 YbaN family protein [Limosilactobacillus reuteri]UZM89414.1 YbaN family protein [Limosilactobacillus reuteri]CUU12549.1 hypothetical membrane protein [Limosilactobacillus reuteri subsp. suis]